MGVDARRVVVVGAGVTGLLSAVRCALAGHHVTVLDRDAIPNPNSTSFDQHRAVRALDPADLAASRRIAVAHRRWMGLEALTGSKFYRRVGMITAWAADEVDTVLKAADAVDLPVSLVEPDDLPHVRFPEGTVGLLEKHGGILLADHALQVLVRWLTDQPNVSLRPWQEVKAVDPDTGRVYLPDAEYLDSDLTLVATGPWSKDLVDLPMVLHRQTLVYLKPPEQLAPAWERTPGIGRIGTRGHAWMLPPGDGTLLKVSSASVCREADVVTTGSAVEERRWAEQVLNEQILTEPDRYTVMAVKRCHYLVDAETGAAHLVRIGPSTWARTASGGDGFRTAPLVAEKILQALTTDYQEGTI
ncbi:NAD(P)/FAD-dependent oxidoreductase [Streptomyces lichenis]|uniref:FAD-dependent oxidoreductase n=1 Tax=Streptomyces lichenis TaxID=2306967 RepID=A0ABT0I3V0_9ACTN|nr:FAD-dependent oxidoreductase [Streptomyces lichenis]MCK8675994.1 FAD-dependent oxidoreductase [Streptomyces lichenis]